jgi:signal transduction histidine kinase
MLLREVRNWLGRLLLGLLLGVAAGLLAYLLARALTTAYLVYQQQQFFQTSAEVLRGGVEALADSDLRELRQRVEALAARYHLLSMRVGFVVAVVATIFSYLALSWRQLREREPNAQQE